MTRRWRLRREHRAVLVGSLVMVVALAVDRLFFHGSNWVIVVFALAPLAVGGCIERAERREQRHREPG